MNLPVQAFILFQGCVYLATKRMPIVYEGEYDLIDWMLENFVVVQFECWRKTAKWCVTLEAPALKAALSWGSLSWKMADLPFWIGRWSYLSHFFTLSLSISVWCLLFQTRSLSTCSPDGTPQRTIVFSEFKEPIDLAIDHRGRFIIADADKVFVLDPSLKPVFSFPPSNHERITCVSVGMDDDILVGTTSALLLFDGGGRLQREIATGPSNARSKSMVTCCVTCPRTGRIVCGVVDSRSNRAELSVCNYKGEFLFRIESSNSRLRRPSGLALTPEGVAFCVDYATHTLRMYKFKWSPLIDCFFGDCLHSKLHICFVQFFFQL